VFAKEVFMTFVVALTLTLAPAATATAVVVVLEKLILMAELFAISMGPMWLTLVLPSVSVFVVVEVLLLKILIAKYEKDIAINATILIAITVCFLTIIITSLRILLFPFYD
jgi:hypothetical protein